jgi:subtilisin family serine protease
MKKQVFILLFLFLGLSLMNFVQAEMLTSDAGVRYEDRILEEFNRLNNTEEKFIEVVIDLKDSSDKNSVLSLFSEEELKDVIILQASPDIVGVEISEEGFFKLIQNNRVESVSYNPPVHATLSESIQVINVNDAWSLGYDGGGIDVCIIDTGVDKYHPSLSGKITGEYCYCYNNCCPGGFSAVNDATDEDGHGTRVAGVVVSEKSSSLFEFKEGFKKRKELIRL